jgi:hypothetical protein
MQPAPGSAKVTGSAPLRRGRESRSEPRTNCRPPKDVDVGTVLEHGRTAADVWSEPLFPNQTLTSLSLFAFSGVPSSGLQASSDQGSSRCHTVGRWSATFCRAARSARTRMVTSRSSPA